MLGLIAFGCSPFILRALLGTANDLLQLPLWSPRDTLFRGYHQRQLLLGGSLHAMPRDSRFASDCELP